MSIFSKIKVPRVRKSSFNLSYVNKLSCDFGQLIPFYLEKVNPGEKIIKSHMINSNLATLTGQLSQAFEIRSEYFFVPSRLLWEQFNDFLVGGKDGKTVYLHPSIDLSEIAFNTAATKNYGTIFDYLGYPYEKPDLNGIYSNECHVDILPLFAYLKVFADYYGDENLNYIDFETCPAGPIDLQTLAIDYYGKYINYNVVGDIADPASWLPLYRNYRKDYLTGCLPFQQKGDVVTIPIDGVGDVAFTIRDSSSSPIATGGSVQITAQAVEGSGKLYTNNAPTSQVITARAENIEATATIEDFRTALRVQEWLEKNARSGTRAYEMLFSHFGVRSQDARLQRAEFLQGNVQVFSVGNVYTTSNASDNGALAGMRYAVANSSGLSRTFKHYFPEHGYVIGILTAYPVASYMNGCRRQFLELDRFDYVWPEFAHLGEQEVFQVEVDARNQTLNGSARPVPPLGTFGYNPRYSQYKTHLNEIHGDFKHNLDYFHDARDFSQVDPHLNKYFISMNPEYNNTNRIFNNVALSTSSQHVYIDILHNVKMIRPLPYYDVPRIL